MSLRSAMTAFMSAGRLAIFSFTSATPAEAHYGTFYLLVSVWHSSGRFDMPIGIGAEICFSREVFLCIFVCSARRFRKYVSFLESMARRGTGMRSSLHALGVFHQGGADQATLKQSAKWTGRAE